MAIYLFILLSLGQLFNLVSILRNQDTAKRVGYFLGSLVAVPPYIWFGWYSGLVF